MVFCITGTLSKVRHEFVALLKSHGGAVASSITGKVTHLIASDHTTAKAATARGMGITIISEDDVFAMIAGEGGGEGGEKEISKKKKKEEDDDGDDGDGDGDNLSKKILAFFCPLLFYLIRSSFIIHPPPLYQPRKSSKIR